MLYCFIISLAYKSFVYAVYLSSFLDELEANHPKTFVSFQSLFYILGEMLTLIVLFVIDLTGLMKRKKKSVRAQEENHPKKSASVDRKSSRKSEDQDEMKKSMVNHSEEDEEDNEAKGVD